MTPEQILADLGHPYEPDVVVATASGDRSAWFPALEQRANGELVVVYYHATSHLGPDDRIALTRSTDGGRTWSEPVRARSARYGEGEWSRPASSPYNRPWIATSAKILEMPDGSLLLPIYGVSDADRYGSIAALRSFDGGHTWPPERELKLAAHPPGISFFEPATTRTGDGTLHVAVRTTTVGYRASSADDGRTWTAATPNSPYYEQVSDLLPLTEGDGRMILQTWGDTSRTLGPGRPTVGRVITPDGVRHPPRVIYTGDDHDESYPTSVQVGPATFLTVNYDAKRKLIAGTYTRLGDYLDD